MIEQETVRALIEAKANLEKVQDYLRQAQHEHNELQDRRAYMRVSDALGLIESILARGK